LQALAAACLPQTLWDECTSIGPGYTGEDGPFGSHPMTSYLDLPVTLFIEGRHGSGRVSHSYESLSFIEVEDVWCKVLLTQSDCSC
jgi:hypothetical protein